MKSRDLISIMLLSFFSLYFLFVWCDSTILPVRGNILLYLKFATIQEQNSPSSSFLSFQQPQLRQPLQQVSSDDAITNNANATNATTTTSSSPRGGIQIAYPRDWIVNDLGNGTVRFSTPLRTDLMRFTVRVVDLPPFLKNITLDKLVELNLNSSKQQLSNFSLIESNATTISSENQSARKIVFTNTNKDPDFPLKFKSMQIFTIKDGQIYTISYVSEDSQYSRYLPTIENMIDSITFTKKIAKQTAAENIINSLVPAIG